MIIQDGEGPEWADNYHDISYHDNSALSYHLYLSRQTKEIIISSQNMISGSYRKIYLNIFKFSKFIISFKKMIFQVQKSSYHQQYDMKIFSLMLSSMIWYENFEYYIIAISYRQWYFSGQNSHIVLSMIFLWQELSYHIDWKNRLTLGTRTMMQ